MNEMSNKAENEKFYFANHLKNASQIISELETKIIQSSSLNEKLKLELEAKQNEIERLSSENSFWRNKCSMAEAKWIGESAAVGSRLPSSQDQETLFLLSQSASEKNKCTALLNNLALEIEKLPNEEESGRLTPVVDDLQNRIEKLGDFIRKIEGKLKETNSSIQNQRTSGSRTPERPRSTFNAASPLDTMKNSRKGSFMDSRDSRVQGTQKWTGAPSFGGRTFRMEAETSLNGRQYGNLDSFGSRTSRTPERFLASKLQGISSNLNGQSLYSTPDRVKTKNL